MKIKGCVQAESAEDDNMVKLYFRTIEEAQKFFFSLEVEEP